MLTLAIYLAGVLAAADAFPPVWPSAIEWPAVRVTVPKQEIQSSCANGQCRPAGSRAFQPRRLLQWKKPTKK
jgi:hypothetical protein